MTCRAWCCKAASRRFDVMKLSVTKKGSLGAWRGGDRGTSSGCGCEVPAPEPCPIGRPNATASVECTATLRSIHADPAPSPLSIEKGLASHPEFFPKTLFLT